MKIQKFAPIFLAGTLIFSACFSSGTKNYYTFDVPAMPDNAACQSVPVARVTTPIYLDQQPIAFRGNDNSLICSDKNRWAEPLTRTLKRQLPERISFLCASRELKQFSSAEIAINRLDGELGKTVKVSAAVKLSNLADENGVPANKIFFVEKTVSVPSRGNDEFASYSAAISEAVDVLAQAVANIICVPAK